MATKIFPTVNDVAPSAGGGKVLTEANLAYWLKQLLGQNFVLSGFTVPASSADLTLSVALGEAMIGGYRVVKDAAENVTCAASATNHIYLKLTRDASQNVTGAVFEVNTTGTAPADSVKIATAVAGVSSISSTTDARQLRAMAVSQMDGATPDQTQAPASPGTGTLAQALSWLSNRIKAITGATNWWDVPAATIAAIWAKFNATTGHKHTGGADDAPAVDHVDLLNKGTNTHTQIDAHLASTANPHSTTAAQVGAAPNVHTHIGSDVTSAVASATNADTVDGYHASAFGPAFGVQEFTGSGTFTVPTGVNRVFVEGWGGGGGGSCGGTGATDYGYGGGGGGYGAGVYSVTPAQQITVTVGAGGAGGVYPGTPDGASGGTSSFGSFCSASGGAGGVFSPGSAGAGGSGSGSTLWEKATGEAGQAKQASAGGAGGAGAYGGAGGAGGGSGLNGSPGTAPGGGGGGGGVSASGQAGGAGASGKVVVRW